MKIFTALATGLVALSLPVWADEGMWTYNGFPSAKVEKTYGFKPSAQWLEQARLSSVRLAGGCSASFVSPKGLIMTNHHCMSDCIQQVSTPTKDYIKNGFYAKAPEDEIKCPNVEMNVLLDIKDVTTQVTQATQGLSGEAFTKKQQAVFGTLEKECGGSDDSIRCDVVTLYQGGVYNLYKYKRYQDARLVFAPEFQSAFFGGDPDNFNFPRYNLDVTFIRVYENNKPVPTNNYFKWSQAGAKTDELVFVSGHPGSTQRLLTVSQLAFLRDVSLPGRLLRLAEIRGELTQFGRQGVEQARISQDDLFGVENTYKALRGQFETLIDSKFFAQKVAQETTLRQQVKNNPQLNKLYGGAWEAIAQAQQEYKNLYYPYTYVERSSAFGSDLFGIARTLVRAAEERPKANTERLREFQDSSLVSLQQGLFSAAPVYPELEQLRLAFSLTKFRELVGTDSPLVQKVLGKESPNDLARALVQGSTLADVKVRKQLWEGGAQAVYASNDPMIKLARLVDGDARALRKRFEERVEGPIKQNSERIAKARFALQGTNTYPDATFTLRLSYGAVKGYNEKGGFTQPFTVIGGVFNRATGKFPFDLPQSWLAAQSKLKLDTPFNFVATTDIIGGNSGSPVINQKAEIVGLVFDGNIQSLGGAYGFDEKVNRTIAVHSSALLESLQTVYQADRVAQELTGK